MQMPRDSFPTDWSPPPIEFLNKNKKVLQIHRRPHKDLEKKPPDQKIGLASLEKLFWSMAGPSQQAVTPEISSGGSECYVNNLDYLLQEKREQAMEQKWEQLLWQDRSKLDSSEGDEDYRETVLTPEHRRLVEKFSISVQFISPVHPGETVFLPRCRPLPCILDSSGLKPHSQLEELFLRSSLPQQLSFLHQGLLSNLYLHASEYPRPLLQWLFQLLTWPPETSSRAFSLLWDLSIDGLFRQPDEDMHLWCPSLQEVKQVFHSLGAFNSALYPRGPYQHHTRVLESEASLGWQEPQDPLQEVALDTKLSYIYKFLILCFLVQPRSYTDTSILSLMELLCHAGLDVGLRLLPKTDLQQLLLLLLENIQEWPGKLQALCCSLSWVSDHHHNLLALVQFFLDVTPRGRLLRSQLSLTVIARMLGQQEALPLWGEKTQLAVLSHLLSLMRPSSLRQYLDAETLPSSQGKQPRASAELDYKVCYLCHSLLTLAGVVVSSQDITPDQWGELQLLCMQLDRHISTHIRESPQAMHRTKLKDLATQTYIRWQDLLAHCQPQGQYFNPWKDI
nr:protein FAM178B isoform X2 [Myodes glareolus]XP_048286294.1 protein FAM178B isoform X2 [Myodes glareolus]XP_048286295.1 protein FAM178B isoform X2 [Myodes glareolus]XP_048286296.1 protein FAM178B isoform X2 [Myodes glareolus]XP_048286297.1 protein FAM178B isoform X2 [Myodes glareolus]